MVFWVCLLGSVSGPAVLLVASAVPIVSDLEAAVAPVRVPLSNLGLGWGGSIRSVRLSGNFDIFSVLFCCLFVQVFCIQAWLRALVSVWMCLLRSAPCSMGIALFGVVLCGVRGGSRGAFPLPRGATLLVVLAFCRTALPCRLPFLPQGEL